MKIRGSKATCIQLVAGSKGPDWRLEDLNASPLGESDAYFGVYLPPKALYPTSRIISKKNVRSKDAVGWVGYDKPPGNNREQEASVYVYCETKRAAMQIERFMDSKAGYKTRLFVEGATFKLRISANREHGNDLQWFQNTIHRLKNVPRY